MLHMKQLNSKKTRFPRLTRFFSFSPLQRCMVRVTNDNFAIGDWCFTPLLTVLQSYNGDIHIIHVFSGFHQYYAGVLKCLAQWHPTKISEDPVRLEPRSPRLQVKHFITEPRRTPFFKITVTTFRIFESVVLYLKFKAPLQSLRKEAFRKHYGKRRNCWWPAFSPFPLMFSSLSKKKKCTI